MVLVLGRASLANFRDFRKAVHGFLNSVVQDWDSMCGNGRELMPEKISIMGYEKSIMGYEKSIMGKCKHCLVISSQYVSGYKDSQTEFLSRCHLWIGYKHWSW